MTRREVVNRELVFSGGLSGCSRTFTSGVCEAATALFDLKIMQKGLVQLHMVLTVAVARLISVLIMRFYARIY